MREDFVEVNPDEGKCTAARHEIHLSFNDDDGAMAFAEWLNVGGWQAFIAWGKTNARYGEYMREEFPETK